MQFNVSPRNTARTEMQAQVNQQDSAEAPNKEWGAYFHWPERDTRVYVSDLPKMSKDDLSAIIEAVQGYLEDLRTGIEVDVILLRQLDRDVSKEPGDEELLSLLRAREASVTRRRVAVKRVREFAYHARLIAKELKRLETKERRQKAEKTQKIVDSAPRGGTQVGAKAAKVRWAILHNRAFDEVVRQRLGEEHYRSLRVESATLAVQQLEEWMDGSNGSTEGARKILEMAKRWLARGCQGEEDVE